VQIAGTAAAALRLGRVMGVGRRDLSQFSVLGRIAAASLLAGLACGAIRVTTAAGFTVPSTLLVYGVVYGAVYAVALFWLGVPDAGERSTLRTLTKRLWRTEHALLSRTP
jgi:hypothetical protein